MNVESISIFSDGDLNPNAFSYLKFPTHNQMVRRSRDVFQLTCHVAGNQHNSWKISCTASLLELLLNRRHVRDAEKTSEMLHDDEIFGYPARSPYFQPRA